SAVGDLIEVRVGGDAGDGVDLTHDAAGDLDRRFALLTLTHPRRHDDGLPDELAPHPGRVQERPQGDALVDAARRNLADALDLCRRDRRRTVEAREEPVDEL